MWAMIAMSIALSIWTGGLSFLTRKVSKRQETVHAESASADVDAKSI